MKNLLAAAVLAVAVVPAASFAQPGPPPGPPPGPGGPGGPGWHGDDRNWDPSRDYRDDRRYDRRMRRDDHIYRGGDGRYYCRRNNGTTGLVVGAVGGGLAGNLLGGGTPGTLLGAGGGALLGRSIDRGKVHCR